MKHIFIDLEFCSCFRRSSPLACETIQVGAVMLDDKLRFVGEFESFVGPDFATTIPSKERELTGITWDMVKDAPCFMDVMDDFIKWSGIDSKDEEYLIYSWSDNDAIQLIRESRVKGHPMKDLGVFERWVDFQKCFMNAFGFKNQKSLEHALEIVQLEFAGDAHKADVDAYNTARLFKFVKHIKGVNLKTTKLVEMKKNLMRAEDVSPRNGNPRYHKFSKPNKPDEQSAKTNTSGKGPNSKARRRRRRQHRG